MKQDVNIFWFRRDLRLHDNAGLYRALKESSPVVPIFIFDRYILDQLENKSDRRVQFIHDALHLVQTELKKIGSTLEAYYGFPEDVFDKLVDKYSISKIFANHDYEPYATERDLKISKQLKNGGVEFKTYKDQVIFDRDEVLKADATPYTVYTPYSRAWKSKVNAFYLKSYPNEEYFHRFFKQKEVPVPQLKEMGFKEVQQSFPNGKLDYDQIRKYHLQRNFPGKDGTSKISVHLRFGTVSIRQLASVSMNLNNKYLNELIWREFYQMILWHFPQVGKGRAFKKQYEQIEWRNNEEEFEKWCDGQTGYPIVDAGMRELNETGYMHNRVRMITASFLCKHLLIDWRWGEAYFAEKLLDFDLASNNGGWQWVSGSGCDAAPYFRIFNPTLQTKNFDSKLTYTRKWVPELEEFTYPKPIVEHEFARKRCIQAYSKALK